MAGAVLATWRVGQYRIICTSYNRVTPVTQNDDDTRRSTNRSHPWDPRQRKSAEQKVCRTLLTFSARFGARQSPMTYPTPRLSAQRQKNPRGPSGKAFDFSVTLKILGLTVQNRCNYLIRKYFPATAFYSAVSQSARAAL